MKEHRYEITNTWTGNLGTGTSGYRVYSRNHEIAAPGKGAAILGSSDPAFRGDAARYNPEELLVASLSTCHMLWLLHVCTDAGITVVAYADHAIGTMRETPDGGGEFTNVTLRPQVTITNGARAGEMQALHHRAHQLCFIARSVNFRVQVDGCVIDAEEA